MGIEEEIEALIAEAVNNQDEDALLDVVEKLAQRQEYSLAERSLEALVELNPSAPNCYLFALFIATKATFLGADDFKKMRSMFDKVLQDEPENVGYKINIGGMLNLYGQWDDAVEVLAGAVEREPDNAYPYALLFDSFTHMIREVRSNPEAWRAVKRRDIRELSGLANGAATRLASIVRKDDTYRKDVLGSPHNEVFVFGDENLTLVAGNRGVPSQISPHENHAPYVLKRCVGDNLFEGMLTRFMEDNIIDQGYSDTIDVPRAVVTAPLEDGARYLVTSFAGGKTLQDCLLDVKSNRTKERNTLLFNIYRTTMRFLGLAHVLGTDLISRYVPALDFQSVPRINKGTYREKIADRLNLLTTHNERRKGEAIDLILRNYDVVSSIFDGIPHVFNKDAHAEQWIVSGWGEERPHKVIGLDWEDRGLVPITQDYVNIFDAHPGNFFSMPIRSLLMLHHLASYNLEYLNVHHTTFVAEKGDQLWDGIKEYYVVANSYLAEGDVESAIEVVAKSIQMAGECVPSDDIVREPMKILDAYNYSRIHRGLELAGAMDSSRCERWYERRAHALKVAKEGLEAVLTIPGIEAKEKLTEIGKGIDLLTENLSY